MSFKRIIFDFNGVLWWDDDLQTQSWQSCAVVLRGSPLSEDELIGHMRGRTNGDILSYLTGRDVVGEELLALTDNKESVYRQRCLAQGEGFTLSPGAVDLFDSLIDSAIPRTIATSSERTNLNFFIEHLHLRRWFDESAISYDDGTFNGKPAPDIYLRAAANLNLDPADCIVVEDARSGIESAHAAGIGHIVAIGPRSRHEMLRLFPGVSEVIENLGQIRRELFRT